VRPIAAGLLAAALLLAAPTLADPQQPSRGPPRVIGRTGNGCISGAVALPAEGRGFAVIHRGRSRYYAHPETIAFVEQLAVAAANAGLPPFYVGDLSQPRGGPMPSGHESHQTGLDVDIWFALDRTKRLTPAERETADLPSMVLADGSAIDPARFGFGQVMLLRLAASDLRVDRIFVSPTIKRALCDGFGGAAEGDRSWLSRIRPWWGHREHFHVRLRCPAGSPDCVTQAPVPAGDGCDASLDWWFQPHPQPPAPAAPRPKRPPLPVKCRALLAQP